MGRNRRLNLWLSYRGGWVILTVWFVRKEAQCLDELVGLRSPEANETVIRFECLFEAGQARTLHRLVSTD